MKKFSPVRATSTSPNGREAKISPRPRQNSPPKAETTITPSQKLAFFKEVQGKMARSRSPVPNKTAQNNGIVKVTNTTTTNNVSQVLNQEVNKTQIINYGTKSPTTKKRELHRNQQLSPGPAHEPDFGLHHKRFVIAPAKSTLELQKKQRKDAPSYIKHAHGSPSREKEEEKPSTKRTIEFKPSPRSQLENERKLLRPAERSASPFRATEGFKPSPRSQFENDRKLLRPADRPNSPQNTKPEFQASSRSQLENDRRHLLPSDRGQSSPLKTAAYSRQIYNKATLNEEPKLVKKREVSPMESRNMKALLENEYAKMKGKGA